MRTFTLLRHHDVSGVSGTGTVAQGVQFDDLHVAVRWLGETPSTAAWDSIEAVEKAHGHRGQTVVVWAEESRTALQRMADYLAGGGVCHSIRTDLMTDDLRLKLHVRQDDWGAWLSALGGSDDASVYVDVPESDYYPQEHRWTSPDGVVTVFHLVRKEAQ